MLYEIVMKEKKTFRVEADSTEDAITSAFALSSQVEADGDVVMHVKEVVE